MQLPPIIVRGPGNSRQVLPGQLFFLPFVLLSMLAMIAAYFSSEWMSVKYYADSYMIWGFQRYAESFIKGGSFNNTALIYNILGIEIDSYWYRAAATGLFCGLIWANLLMAKPGRLTPSLIFITYGSVYIGLMYLSQISKEFVVLLLIISFLLMARNRWTALAWTVLAVMYAYYFRGYWYLVLYLYLWLLLTGAYCKRPWQLFLTIVIGLLVITLAHEVLNGGSILKHREIVNAGREGNIYAKTLIKPLFESSNPLTDWLNCALIWMQTLIPVKLLFSGSPQHLVSGLMMLTTFMLLFQANSRFWSGDRQNAAIYRGFCLFMSFTAVQSCFEPDYGSMLKHMTPLLPLAIAFICSQMTRPAKAEVSP